MGSSSPRPELQQHSAIFLHKIVETSELDDAYLTWFRKL
uniref:Uncharacterized protein n=1 Tax=Rhizobium rhizogenes TaxID=359 RepID=A0A7S4ZRE1_RHIRH|nr:hypothetical protein pC5.7b_310 [Rhizobium rhizogenes]